MNTWYFIGAPAWALLGMTAAARLSDMRRDQWSIREHVRRLGMIGVGGMSALMLATPFVVDTRVYSPTTWKLAAFAWSWALVWITTPGMPPWYDFMLGVHRRTEEWAGHGWRARLLGEWRALRDSFCPKCAARRRQRMEQAATIAAARAEAAVAEAVAAKAAADAEAEADPHPHRRATDCCPRVGTDPDEDFPRPN